MSDSKMSDFSSGLPSTPSQAWTPGPWDYVATTKDHGPYVTVGGRGFGDICDCYTMSNVAAASVRNGGTSYPINFQGVQADCNARLIAAAPDLFATLKALLVAVEFAAPPKNFGTDNPCFEARVPVQFVTDARAALAKALGQ